MSRRRDVLWARVAARVLPRPVVAAPAVTDIRRVSFRANVGRVFFFFSLLSLVLP